MSRVTTPAARWRSLYGRWYLRHSLQTYLLVRVALTMALLWAKQPVMGPDVGAGMVPIAAFAVWADRTPRATRVLMANLGFTSVEMLLASALVAAAAEPVTQLVLLPALGQLMVLIFGGSGLPR